MSVTIRLTILSWAGALGWNPDIRDGECMQATDPNGMFVAKLDGMLVGCSEA